MIQRKVPGRQAEGLVQSAGPARCSAGRRRAGRPAASAAAGRTGRPSAGSSRRPGSGAARRPGRRAAGRGRAAPPRAGAARRRPAGPCPRSTTGASDAGPLPRGGPGTKSPQRRQRQASPSVVRARNGSRSSGSSGAYVAWPWRPQERSSQLNSGSRRQRDMRANPRCRARSVQLRGLRLPAWRTSWVCRSTRSPAPRSSGPSAGTRPGPMAAATSIMRVQQLLLARFDDVLRPHELTFARYEALVLLAFSRSGELPMGKIGERLMVHPTSVTNIVQRLEQQGLVEPPTEPAGRPGRARRADRGRARGHASGPPRTCWAPASAWTPSATRVSASSSSSCAAYGWRRAISPTG